MGKIRMRSKSVSDNPELKAPVFNFSRYAADGEHTYYNNENQIDFVTDGNSLYVCLSHDGVTPTYENIDDQADFLKLVSQGPQGIRGPRGYDGDSAETPRLSAEFDNDQLRVYINGEVETVSPRLTGKSWRPKREDNMLVWELSNKMYAPEPIDLEELRPIQEKPLLLRVDSDNTKRTDEKSGPARFIQWKYEGDPHWTNLISISELMNLTLAGITIFPVENSETGKTEYHLGHKEVLEATYESDKDGHRIISNVELGHVLFDAGPIPTVGGETGPDYGPDIELILQEIAGIKASMVKSVNDIGPTPSNGNVDLGRLVKTVNYVGPTPDGNIEINLTPYVRKSDLITINGSPIYNGGNININGGSASDGLKDVEIRVNSSTGKLEYRKWLSSNSSWSDYEEIMSISAGSGGEHVDLRVTDDNEIQLKYNDGNWETKGVITIPKASASKLGGIKVGSGLSINNDGVLSVTGSGTGGYNPNAIVDASLNSTTRVITFTRQSGNNPITIQLPSSGTSGITEADVKEIIGRALEGLLDDDSVIQNYYVRASGDNYFIRINDLSGYATQVYVNNKINEALSQIGDGNITVETFRPFSLYTRTATSAAPAKPGTTAWKWYPNIDNMLHDASKQNPTAQDDDVVAGWSNNIPNATSQLPYLWQAWNVFSSVDGTTQGAEWEGPCPMFGEDGQDGKDGDNRKQIYKLCETYDYFIENRSSLKPSGVGPNVPNNWTAVEAGISEEYKIEMYCYSEYDGDTKQWSAWQGPYIWSMWSENGADGNGVEYIFYQQDSGTIASGNNPHNLSAAFIAGATYQTPDFQPNSVNTNGAVSGTWTDEPSGVDSSHRFEFVCIRKYDGETQEWGAFSEPKIWSHYGRDAVDLTNDYLIVPTFNDVTKTPEGNGYIPMGTLKFEVYKNGVKQSGQYYGSSNTSTVAAYLGGLDSGQFLDGVLSDRVYTIDIHKNNKNMSVTWEDEPFIQILWYENNKQGKILDSAIVPVIIPGQNGSSQSLDGTVLRVSNYDSNGHYLNGEVATNGIYYLDVVKYNGDYYKCLTSNTSAAPTDNSGNVNAGWELFAVRSNSAFNTLLAQSAYIQDLTAKQVVITDANDTIVAGMASGTAIPSIINPDNPNSVTNAENVRIWAGPISNGNLQTAPFRVTNEGEMYATKAHIVNNSTSNSIDRAVEISPAGIDIEYTESNVNSGVRIAPSYGYSSSATLDVWRQDPEFYSIKVSGGIVHTEGILSNSITVIDTAGSTQEIWSNIVIVTHNYGGAVGSPNKSVAEIPAIQFVPLKGAHITFLRTSTGVCTIKVKDHNNVNPYTIKQVLGTTVADVTSIDFSDSINRIDIIYLNNDIYAWTT